MSLSTLKRGPGGTKMSPAERAALKQRQSDAILLNSKVDLVRKGIKHYPGLLADKFVNIMKQHSLVDCNDQLILPKSEGEPAIKKPKTSEMVEPVLPPGDSLVKVEPQDSDEQDADGKEDGDGKVDGAVAAGDSASIATGYWKLSGHSVTELQKYCSFMSPTVLSLPNLRQMVQRGRRAESRTLLLELIEAGTGLSPDFVPRNELWQTENLLRYMAQRHVTRGSRLNDLPSLPPRWSEHGGGGVYDFEVLDDKTVMLLHPKLCLKKKLPVRHARAIKDVTALRIDCNFSESGATLCEDDAKGLNFKLMTLFPDQLLPQYADAEDDNAGDTGGTLANTSVCAAVAPPSGHHAKLMAAPEGDPKGAPAFSKVPSRRMWWKTKIEPAGSVDEYKSSPPLPSASS